VVATDQAVLKTYGPEAGKAMLSVGRCSSRRVKDCQRVGRPSIESAGSKVLCKEVRLDLAMWQTAIQLVSEAVASGRVNEIRRVCCLLRAIEGGRRQCIKLLILLHSQVGWGKNTHLIAQSETPYLDIMLHFKDTTMSEVREVRKTGSHTMNHLEPTEVLSVLRAAKARVLGVGNDRARVQTRFAGF